MRCSWSTRPRATQGRPSGKILAMTALSLPVFLGMLGLTIDGGLLMATERQVQNAADAAATAAAMDLFRGSGTSTALATANSFVSDNGLSVSLSLNAGSGSSLNIPPTQGPHAGDSHYAEAILSTPAKTFFIQALIGTSTQTVSARAVAGYEPVSSGEGAIVLSPTITPGLSVSGNGTRLVVNGTIVVNSAGAGLDQYGQP
ncbi:MAG TPA: pilus assembly protein TadG-related protein, partial [Isosphaeraceae bacterium]|nr:pilus assembly protein TadG-related protein [Isosphaeraceae bacterium]